VTAAILRINQRFFFGLSHSILQCGDEVGEDSAGGVLGIEQHFSRSVASNSIDGALSIDNLA